MFGLAERVADAVLYEGNVVDPYAASASKNRLRWQFGIVAPQAPRDHGEPSLAQTECLIGADSRHSTVSSRRLWVRVRCLRPRPGTTDAARPWLQGVPTAIDALVAMPLDRLPLERDVALTEADVDLHLVVRASAVERFVKVQLRLENREPWRPEFSSDRSAMFDRSVVAAHLLIAVAGGAFVSLIEPPADAAAAADACRNRHTWPVLVGDPSERTLMLSSPILLYDYPSADSLAVATTQSA